VTSLPTVPPRIAPLRPTTAPTGTVEPRTLRSGADLDGDGVAYPDDCDDQDGSRYPGAMEIANDRDEDCNPETIGTLDLDGDGYTDSRVSNRAHYAGQTGLDCDDTKAGIRPDAQELPNRLDDNCDGMVDNLLGEWWTPR
jgi:hypothetical protein